MAKKTKLNLLWVIGAIVIVYLLMSYAKKGAESTYLIRSADQTSIYPNGSIMMTYTLVQNSTTLLAFADTLNTECTYINKSSTINNVRSSITAITGELTANSSIAWAMVKPNDGATECRFRTIYQIASGTELSAAATQLSDYVVNVIPYPTPTPNGSGGDQVNCVCSNQSNVCAGVVFNNSCNVAICEGTKNCTNATITPNATTCSFYQTKDAVTNTCKTSTLFIIIALAVIGGIIFYVMKKKKVI